MIFNLTKNLNINILIVLKLNCYHANSSAALICGWKTCFTLLKKKIK